MLNIKNMILTLQSISSKINKQLFLQKNTETLSGEKLQRTLLYKKAAHEVSMKLCKGVKFHE